MSEPDFEDNYEDDSEEELEDQFDCALGADGQCAMAGSEDCDWECPMSHGRYYAGSNAWHKAHNAGVPITGCLCPECLEAALRQPLPPQGEG